METTSRAMKIQAIKVVVTELVITETSLDIIKHIAIRNRGINKQILMEILINKKVLDIGLVPSQDGPFFYTCFHLSALQNCALIFQPNFQLIFKL